MLESVGIHAIVTSVHHIVVRFRKSKCRVCAGHDLESFIAAGCSDDGIGRGDCGDDVLDDALGEGICDAGDVELLGTMQSALIEPGDVFGVVCVEGVVLQY